MGGGEGGMRLSLVQHLASLTEGEGILGGEVSGEAQVCGDGGDGGQVGSQHTRQHTSQHVLVRETPCPQCRFQVLSIAPYELHSGAVDGDDFPFHHSAPPTCLHHHASPGSQKGVYGCLRVHAPWSRAPHSCRDTLHGHNMGPFSLTQHSPMW